MKSRIRTGSFGRTLTRRAERIAAGITRRRAETLARRLVDDPAAAPEDLTIDYKEDTVRITAPALRRRLVRDPALRDMKGLLR